MRRDGFTLVELIVVMLIIGVLTAVAVPKYQSMVESSKADQAATQAKLIGLANASFAVDHGGATTSGRLSSACNSQTCLMPPAAGALSACNLVACGYLAKIDWDRNDYAFEALGQDRGAPCGAILPSGGYLACAARCRDNGCSAGDPYSTWRFLVRKDGEIEAQGENVAGVIRTIAPGTVTGTVTGPVTGITGTPSAIGQ